MLCISFRYTGKLSADLLLSSLQAVTAMQRSFATASSSFRVFRPLAKPCTRAGMRVRARAEKQRIRVIETALGGPSDKIKLLRHLGLRVGEDDEDFVEAHFGPGEDGQMSEGEQPCSPAGAFESWQSRPSTSTHSPHTPFRSCALSNLCTWYAFAQCG